MTMDRTLKQRGSLLRTRCVLTRSERIAQLMEEEKFDPEADSPLGLPKVRVRHSRAGTKTKKAEEPTAETAEGAADTAQAAAPKGKDTGPKKKEKT